MTSQGNSARSKHVARPIPDFLIIGAQRSGTSWLNKNLGIHPQIWMPPFKEIHHFDADVFPKRLKRSRYIRQFRRRFIQANRKAVKLDKRLISDLRWDAHYFFGKRTNDWYVNIFRPKPGQIAGEATPAYATLKLEKIKEIHDINPHVKIIYQLRDPIERTWSHVTKDLAKRKNRMLSEVSDEEIVAMFESSDVVIRSNYVQSLERWESVFPPEQFLITFFEEVIKRPKQSLLGFHQFLSVDSSEEYISPEIREKVNPAGKFKSPIPPRFQVFLAEQCIDQIRKLNNRFGTPTDQWLHRAKNILTQKP